MKPTDLLSSISSETGKIAMLIDPDKINNTALLLEKLHQAENAGISYIFVGGSYCESSKFKTIVKTIKNHCSLPVILFPGDKNQLSDEADGLLYLSLLSGRNPKYLIEQHIESAFELYAMNIEIIPTGYILIDGGCDTSVVKVSKTKPIENDNIKLALKTSLAGIFQGKKIIYFDSGSGAQKTINNELVKEYKKLSKTPLIVGGGINTTKKIIELKKLGVNIIVVGNHIENDETFLDEIKAIQKT
jgi:phosphoglycerol geranylgeranyltransferase